MAFTGVAVYDVFSSEVAENVANTVSMISPTKAPFLDWVGDGQNPVTSNQYSWEEKALLPETFTASTAIASTAAVTAIGFDANGKYLRVGDVLRFSNAEMAKIVSVVSTGSTTVYVSRGYAGTTADSLAIGDPVKFIAAAVVEGSSAREQRRLAKGLVSNYVQNFREDIKVSKHVNNVKFKADGQPNAFDEDTQDKIVEVTKQLERAVLMGRTNGNTIGAGDAETTLAGLYSSIPATNVVSHATFSTSMLDNMIEKTLAWTEPGEFEAEYCIWGGNTAFRKLTNSREAAVETTRDNTEAGVAAPTVFHSAYGDFQVKRIRHLPAGTFIFVRKDLIEVPNFSGCSFMVEEYKDGDSARKGYVEGTYGLRFRNPLHSARFDGIA